MFTDDTKCLRIIKEPNDAYLMQLDLNNLSAWSESSDLSFKYGKFVHLHFWNNSSSSDAQSYFINRTKITLRNSTKDLGIILSNNLDWSKHYHSITAKAWVC